MSQFLLCKTDKDLGKYGIRISHCFTNSNLLYRVKQVYFPYESDRKIWSIENINDVINDFDNKNNILFEIYNISDEMIFWYGLDFSDLNDIYSYEELNKTIEMNLNNSCFELYIRAFNKNHNIR